MHFGTELEIEDLLLDSLMALLAKILRQSIENLTELLLHHHRIAFQPDPASYISPSAKEKGVKQ